MAIADQEGTPTDITKSAAIDGGIILRKGSIPHDKAIHPVAFDSPAIRTRRITGESAIGDRITASAAGIKPAAAKVRGGSTGSVADKAAIMERHIGYRGKDYPTTTTGGRTGIESAIVKQVRPILVNIKSATVIRAGIMPESTIAESTHGPVSQHTPSLRRRRVIGKNTIDEIGRFTATI